VRKPLPITAIIISIIFIALSITVPLRNSINISLASSAKKSAVKPVFFHVDTDNKRFIDGLATYAYAAHRGAPTAVKQPENSLPAFKACKRLGFKIVETDLQLTKDGKWIVFHDYILDRTSNGKGPVKYKSFRDIRRLKLKGNEKENLSIPTLEEFLSLCSNEQLIPILDIKPTEKELTDENYNDLLITLSKYDLLDKSMFTSHSKEVLTELRRRNNITAIAAMLEPSQENINFVKELSNTFLYVNYEKLTDENIELINSNNLKFGVWTINDKNVANYFLQKGAIMVVTDDLQTQ
jgi:glycerophosphoryl diester phosphodiesterase